MVFPTHQWWLLWNWYIWTFTKDIHFGTSCGWVDYSKPGKCLSVSLDSPIFLVKWITMKNCAVHWSILMLREGFWNGFTFHNEIACFWGGNQDVKSPILITVLFRTKVTLRIKRLSMFRKVKIASWVAMPFWMFLCFRRMAVWHVVANCWLVRLGICSA